ncbi:hypothetical protein BsWGS_26054 [Bradybaena similaris]
MGKRKGQIAQMSRSSLVKDIQKKHGHRKAATDTFLHTTELDDGITYNRINFQSVTEQNTLEDFLTTAELAGKDFTAERQNIQIISQPGEGIRLTGADLQKISEAQHANRDLLQIPRRPRWDGNTTKEMLELMERDSFTDWRRQLKLLEEKEHIQLTPYEKNLDFWRQLWRVIERSDVVVQIVDARNPLLFRCEDLETYVKEVDPRKTVMLLINKADFLTLQQRQQWAEYFNKERVRVVFFSAKVETERQEGFPETTANDGQIDEESGDDEDSDEDSQDDNSNDDDDNCEEKKEDKDKNEMDCENEVDESKELTNSESSCDASVNTKNTLSTGCAGSSVTSEKDFFTDPDLNISNNPEITSAEELLDIFRKLAHPSACSRADDVKTVGMVGYPNVGKSSTINVILREKKLAVSATPGRTKHLQRIPRNVLEATYSIMILRPSLDDNADRTPTAEELLNAYGAMRGFMNARGVPDGPRASRYILKDFVKGKLLYCEPPPGVDGASFQDKDRISVLEKLRPACKVAPPQTRSSIDTEFFSQKQSKVHYRGSGGLSEVVGASSHAPASRLSESSTLATDHLGSTTSVNSLSSKPWKKHNNRNKKEKLRRLHRDLDV